MLDFIVEAAAAVLFERLPRRVRRGLYAVTFPVIAAALISYIATH